MICGGVGRVSEVKIEQTLFDPEGRRYLHKLYSSPRYLPTLLDSISIAILAQYLPIKTTAGKQEADEEQNISVTKEAAGIVAKYLTVQQENQETPAT